jgi:hypothetical protein
MDMHKHWGWLGMALLALAFVACDEGSDDDDDSALDEEDGAMFVDEALQGCVREHLGLESDHELVPGDVGALAHLDCPDDAIADLKGLEHFTGLQTLTLWENDVTDITPLADLTSLTWLQLGHNDIRDLSPLAGLTQLQRLGLAVNDVTDVSPLAGLDQLVWLNLDRNDLLDNTLGALCDLDALTWVTVEHNYIDELDELDCLGDADVFHDYQDDPEDRSSEANPLSAIAPVNGNGAGTLVPVATDDGRLSLSWQMADQRVDVIPEFAGELAVVEGAVFHHTASFVREIGSLTASGWELCSGPHAGVCDLAIGRKVSGDSVLADARPVVTATLSYAPAGGGDGRDAEYGAVDEGMLDYVFASPNQFDAGSCIFMATTGCMEVLMNQHTDLDAVDYMGDTDLSERFLMTAYNAVPDARVDYFLTDLIHSYNYLGGSMLDRDYPFQAGYIEDTFNGVVESGPMDPDAYFSAYYSWLDLRPDGWEDMMVETPRAARTVIFVDPDRDQNSYWAVALGDDEIVEQIKYELRTKRAPVMVVYNHYLYWHADIIVGYDDTVDTNGCPMVEASLDYFEQQGATSYVNAIENHIDDLGGCTDQGIFYVRDSIYDGTDDEPMYEYSVDHGYSQPYSRRIIERSYNWVKFLGNHAYSIHRW